MSELFPLRFRRLDDENLIFANEAGGFFKAGNAFLERLGGELLNQKDQNYLDQQGMLSGNAGSLNETTFLHNLAGRLRAPSKLSYVILIPTLRCDLACSYCQVSRAALGAKGFDWTDETLENVLHYLDENCDDDVQIEFQGGEPTLRIDLVTQVIEYCRQRFSSSRFIICTNLSSLSDEFRKLIKDDDVFISTSLDGPEDLHETQRTEQPEKTSTFLENLELVLLEAPDRVSALPTLNPTNLPKPSALLDVYSKYRMHSIYLRPVVFHGFARKRHPDSAKYQTQWREFYDNCITEMIERNAYSTDVILDEFYLTTVLKRLLRPREDKHTDLRSPNWLGYDHLTINYDGIIYPSDEARMMARNGLVDLSMGSVSEGLDETRRRELQGRAFNALDPWCSECPYQAACGSDPIDDLTRNGRTDTPRPLTSFCQKHLHLFDLAMDLIYSKDRKVQHSLAAWLNLPHPISLGGEHID